MNFKRIAISDKWLLFVSQAVYNLHNNSSGRIARIFFLITYIRLRIYNSKYIIKVKGGCDYVH